MSGITNGRADEYSPQPDLGGITDHEFATRGRHLPTIEHHLVLTMADRVDRTGVLDVLTRWRDEDNPGRQLGGRPALISDRAVLTGLLLLAHEGKPLWVRELALLLQVRLTPESRELLGVPTPTHALMSNAAEVRRWYNNTHNALHRIVSLLDPFPYDRRFAKTYVEAKEILDNHDRDLERHRKNRLDEFTRLFLKMTFQSMPRDVRRASKRLDISLDQTYVASPTKHGVSRTQLPGRAAEQAAINDQSQLTPGPVDVAVGLYVSQGVRGNDRPGGPVTYDPTDPAWAKKPKDQRPKFKVGWAANIAVRVDAERPSSNRFPLIAVAGNLSIPNIGVSEEATVLIEHARRIADDTDLTPGVVDADKQYYAQETDYERLLGPTLEAGFLPSTDYRKDRENRAAAPGGALFIDDGIYCPATPAAYLSATPDYLKGTIDKPTFKLRIAERKAYHLQRKERPDANGKVPYRCPALGASPTVTCPIREMAKNAAQKPRPHIEDDDLPAVLDRICTQHSVSIKANEMARRKQEFLYGSDEWEEFHEHARNSIESLNGQSKDNGQENIQSAATRRVRGIAAAQLFITILLTRFNLRKIAAFLYDRELTTTQHTNQPGRKLVRRRDREWRNAYTGTQPDRVIPLLPPPADTPLRT